MREGAWERLGKRISSSKKKFASTGDAGEKERNV